MLEGYWFVTVVVALALLLVVELIAVLLQCRRADEALRESMELLSGFYWESDSEHRFTLRGMAGKSSTVSMFQRAALVGRRHWEIPHLSPDEAGWQAHRAVLEAHQPFRAFEVLCRGANGAEHHISINGDPVFDASGAFKGYRGVVIGVPELKHAEQRLQDLSHAVGQSR